MSYQQNHLPSGETQKKNKAEAQTSQKLINLSMKFGDDGGQDQLIDLNINFYSHVSNNITEKHRNLLKEIQSKEEVNKDTLIVIKFEVEKGRQRESFEFIEKGLDQDIGSENSSAMQNLFYRPKTTGRIELKEGKGFIYVIYRFYSERIQHLENYSQLMKYFSSQVDYTIQVNAQLKGSVQANKRSFSSLKPDFFKLHIQSQKLTSHDYLNFMEETSGGDNQILQSQLYKLIKNLQVVDLDLKFNSIRQIMKFYDRILQVDENSSKNDFRELPLQNKGIFRNFASMKIIMQDKMAIQFEAKYKTEEVMLRLIARFLTIYFQQSQK